MNKTEKNDCWLLPNDVIQISDKIAYFNLFIKMDKS